MRVVVSRGTLRGVYEAADAAVPMRRPDVVKRHPATVPSAPDRRQRSCAMVTVRSVYAVGSIGKEVPLARTWAPQVIAAMVHRVMHTRRAPDESHEVSAVHRVP